MSRRKQYGLIFYKKQIDGINYNISVQNNPGGLNSVLAFLDNLSKKECEAFINDLNSCLNANGNIDEGFFSDSVEHMKINYNYPNVNIDDILIVQMQEMKELLMEWLDFINS